MAKQSLIRETGSGKLSWEPQSPVGASADSSIFLDSSGAALWLPSEVLTIFSVFCESSSSLDGGLEAETTDGDPGHLARICKSCSSPLYSQLRRLYNLETFWRVSARFLFNSDCSCSSWAFSPVCGGNFHLNSKRRVDSVAVGWQMFPTHHHSRPVEVTRNN